MPRPLVVFGLLFFAVTSGRAQDPMRPWAAWRTLETPHFRVHYPEEYERWAVDAARRVEGVDSAIARLVGFAPKKQIDIVIHDPYTMSNGYVIPLIDATTSVWWATPPDPRSDIGNYRSWGELLASHELTHVAHLTRPSRNSLQQLFWSLMPASVGPIARKSPHWVIEGYPTVVEGQITGSGRPNGVWRPAILRQWAIEGQLPSYDAMNGSSEFHGGAFPYLSGSAYLEWLLKRQGDTSLVNVWRRMTAVTNRSFDQAFTGVYGDSPSYLYEQHVAELTGDAMRAKTALENAGLRQGDLVQHLNWETGDPAISQDGDRVALSIGEQDKPSRLVVWKTETDTEPSRRRTPAKVDPQDVPDKSFYPAPQREEHTLTAVNGNAFVYPRWFADNRRIMVTRWTGRSDGTYGPDAYIWNTVSGSVTRVTNEENVLQADPSPDSREAVAMRCHQGHCDIVRLYFAVGSVTSLMEGTPTRSYYRPRFSPDGRKFAAAVSDSGRWYVVVADRDGKNAKRVGPDDGANRYDAQWTLGSDSLIVVSERGGVPNLEFMSLDGGVKTITRVTGAAVAPELNREDRSIWYLSLQSRGFDVRRIPRDAPMADSVVTIDAAHYAFAGVQQMPDVKLSLGPSRATEDYGFGVSHTHWFPGATGSADGFGGLVTVFRGDIVGRFNTSFSAAYGEQGTWRGTSARAVWRYMRPAIELGFHTFEQRPSQGRDSVYDADSLDTRGFLGVVALSHTFRNEWWRIGARTGAAFGAITPWMSPKQSRTLGFLDLDLQLRQMGASRGAIERLRLHVDDGVTRTEFRRYMATLQLASTGDGFPLDFSATLGRHYGTRHPFEEFSIGGLPAATMDSSVMVQRWSMPMLPTGTARGRALEAWRIAFPSFVTFYAEGASLGADIDGFDTWHRAVGIEKKVSTPPIPVGFAPAMQTVVGLGFSVDRPLNDKFRAYILMRYEP